jgi:hypothetical protein
LIRQKARAVREAGLARVIEALCVILVISGFWPVPEASGRLSVAVIFYFRY